MCKTLIMGIELSGVQFGLKSYTWFRFEITIIISDQNCTPLSSIPIINVLHTSKITFYSIVASTCILLMLYWVGLKLNSSIFFFWGGGGGRRVLETKVAKFATWYSLSSFSCNLIGYFKQVNLTVRDLRIEWSDRESWEYWRN